MILSGDRLLLDKLVEYPESCPPATEDLFPDTNLEVCEVHFYIPFDVPGFRDEYLHGLQVVNLCRTPGEGAIALNRSRDPKPRLPVCEVGPHF